MGMFDGLTGMFDNFQQKMDDPMMQLGLALMSQWKTPPGQFPSVGAALENYQKMQQGSYLSKKNQMEMEKLKREQARQKRVDELVSQIPGIRDKYTRQAQTVNIPEQATFEQPPMLDSTGGLAELMGKPKMFGTQMPSAGGAMVDYQPQQEVNIPKQFDKAGYDDELRTLAMQAFPEKQLEQYLGGNDVEYGTTVYEDSQGNVYRIPKNRPGLEPVQGVKGNTKADKPELKEGYIVWDEAKKKWVVDPDLYAKHLEAKKAGAARVSQSMGKFQDEWEKYAVQLRETADKTAAISDEINYVVNSLEGYSGGPITEAKGWIGRLSPDSEWGRIASMKQFADTVQARLAPTMRVAGSGATSDFEMKMWMRAVPTLATLPEGRQMIKKYNNRLAERANARAEIEMDLIKEGNRNPAEIQKRMKERFGDSFLDKEDKAFIQSSSTTTPDQEGWSIKRKN